ncbi:hypothetical protein T439DRAFT_378216 [Meredithblackwellia eburnea MCA 4105]
MPRHLTDLDKGLALRYFKEKGLVSETYGALSSLESFWFICKHHNPHIQAAVKDEETLYFSFPDDRVYSWEKLREEALKCGLFVSEAKVIYQYYAEPVPVGLPFEPLLTGTISQDLSDFSIKAKNVTFSGKPLHGLDIFFNHTGVLNDERYYLKPIGWFRRFSPIFDEALAVHRGSPVAEIYKQLERFQVKVMTNSRINGDKEEAKKQLYLPSIHLSLYNFSQAFLKWFLNRWQNELAPYLGGHVGPGQHSMGKRARTLTPISRCDAGFRAMVFK